MRCPRLHWVDVWQGCDGVGSSPFTVHQMPERNRAQPSRTLLKKTPPSLNPLELLKIHGLASCDEFFQIEQYAAHSDPHSRLGGVNPIQTLRRKDLLNRLRFVPQQFLTLLEVLHHSLFFGGGWGAAQADLIGVVDAVPGIPCPFL